MRLFLAINLDHDVRHAMYDAARPLRDASSAVAWIPADRLHLTLKFLGEVAERDAERLTATLAPVVGRHRAFEADIAGAGAFPNLRRPRVVWIGVADDPKLELLHHDVASACADLGHEIEARAFRAHVTLGRARDGLERDDARRLAAAVRAVHFQGTLDVRSVDLMMSELSSSGARHTRLVAIPLSGER